MQTLNHYLKDWELCHSKRDFFLIVWLIFSKPYILWVLNSCNYFCYKTQRSDARNADKLKLEIPFTRLKAFEKTIVVKGVNLYNTIDNNFRSDKKSCSISLTLLGILCLMFLIHLNYYFSYSFYV
jgi:hypothetical protein